MTVVRVRKAEVYSTLLLHLCTWARLSISLRTSSSSSEKRSSFMRISELIKARF